MEPEAQAAIDAALQAHFDGAGAGGDSPPASAPANAPAQSAQEAPGTTPAQPAQDSPFTNTALDSLPPEVQPYYKALQGDYTRKMQALAEQRAQFETLTTAGIAPDAALQAYEFYNRLNTDADFASEIVNTLAPQLQAMGKWQYQGAQETAAPAAVEDDTGDLDPNYTAIQQEMARLRSEFEATRQQAEAQQYLAEMSRQQALVQQQHPDYGDQDFKAVYALSHSTAGDLLQANALYQGIKAQAIAQYAASKMAMPTVTAPVTNTVTMDESAKPTTLDEAHEMALAHLRGLAANS